MDSGVTNHVIVELSNMNLQQDYKRKAKLVLGNGSKLKISHVDSSKLLSSQSSRPLHLTNILHAHKITKTLISRSQFT